MFRGLIDTYSGVAIGHMHTVHKREEDIDLCTGILEDEVILVID